MDQRITELERKVSYQDKLLQELNEVIIELNKRLNLLESKQKAMKDQFESGNRRTCRRIDSRIEAHRRECR